MNKKSNKFQYPHPLVKNLQTTKVYKTQNVNEILQQRPHCYDNNYVFSSNIKSYISPKLLRLTNTKIIPEQKFGVLMQPFHAKQEVQFIPRNSIQLQQYKCQNCRAFLSSQCQSISLYEIKCKICQKVQSMSLQVKNSLENIPRCYDIGEEDRNQQIRINEKNICFVIQASEFNYNYRVHQVIQSCLKSLQSTLAIDGVNKEQVQVQTEDQQASVKSNTVFQCQSICQSTNYNISFILFNDKNIFVINQYTNDVMVFNQSFISQSEMVSDILIGFDDFFRPISGISQETFNLVQEILYDSYLKNTSCLDVTTKFIQKYLDKFYTENQRNDLNQNLMSQSMKEKRKIQYKFFVNSLKFTKRVQQQSENQQKKGILQNISNTISQNLHLSNKKVTNTEKIRDISQSQLSLCPNFQFFYLPQSNSSNVFISQKQVVKKLNNNLYKMYPETEDKGKKGVNDLFNQIYYDLFENLSSQKYFNIKIRIQTSQNLQVLAVGNQILGYNDCSSSLKKIHSSHQTGKKFNTYEIIINCLQPNNTLPLDLKITKPSSNFMNHKHSNSETMHYMQISFEYSKSFVNCENKPYNENFNRVFNIQVASLDRAINIRERIYSSMSTYVDDQVLFYFYLRWIMAECHKTKTNHTILKRLLQQMEKISDQFKDSYGQINFHKEYVRIFLYSFMITNKALVNGINENFYYERHQFVKNSMQNFSKTFYPRTYSIFKHKESNQIDIKNVKTAPKNFRSDSLLLLENGKNLFMIIGEDNSVEDLKTIFGTCFIHEIQQMTQLPQIESNIRYRQLIDLVRLQHESNFLPLKIMELFSPQFDSEISHSLYVKENHQKFMKKLWDMESAHKARS